MDPQNNGRFLHKIKGPYRKKREAQSDSIPKEIWGRKNVQAKNIRLWHLYEGNNLEPLETKIRLRFYWYTVPVEVVYPPLLLSNVRNTKDF